MTDHRGDAEALFRAIAARRDVALVPHQDPTAELAVALQAGEGAAPVILTLSHGDELNLGIGDFWASFYPFDAVSGLYEKTVEGWFTGQSRLVNKWRGGRLLLIDLEVRMKDGRWQRVYRQVCSRLAPVLVTRTEIRTGL